MARVMSTDSLYGQDRESRDAIGIRRRVRDVGSFIRGRVEGRTEAGHRYEAQATRRGVRLPSGVEATTGEPKIDMSTVRSPRPTRAEKPDREFLRKETNWEPAVRRGENPQRYTASKAKAATGGAVGGRSTPAGDRMEGESLTDWSKRWPAGFTMPEHVADQINSADMAEIEADRGLQERINRTFPVTDPGAFNKLGDLTAKYTDEFLDDKSANPMHRLAYIIQRAKKPREAAYSRAPAAAPAPQKVVAPRAMTRPPTSRYDRMNRAAQQLIIERLSNRDNTGHLYNPFAAIQAPEFSNPFADAGVQPSAQNQMLRAMMMQQMYGGYRPTGSTPLPPGAVF